jgi:hypothetical protein
MLAGKRCPLPRHEMIPGPCEKIYSDSINMYPKKSLKELKECGEQGLFAIIARVVGITQVDQWWYPVCDCRKVVSVVFGTYYCLDCQRTAFRIGSK